MNFNEQPERKSTKFPLYPWNLDTTQAMRKPGGRDLEDYKEFLGFDEHELEGKKVLDLGSGSLEKLSRDLKEKGIKTSVISLNPDYILSKYRNIITKEKNWQRKSVAGIGQALPFTDDSFDVILGLESITFYEDALHEPEAARAWAKEVARVLKPKGVARLGEILGLSGEAKQKAWQGIIKLLEDLGLETKIEPFKIKEDPKPRYRLIISKP